MPLSYSPNLLKGGIVQMDAASGAVIRVIALQYNPDSVSRTLSAQAVGGESVDRLQPLRLIAAPTEKITVEIELDATDRLEFPDSNADAIEYGIQPELAALEGIIYPYASDVNSNNELASRGTLEIAPKESPLTIFVWSKQRVLPVRLSEFTITEEAFDVNLNPIRAKISLSMRVLGVNDLGFSHRGGSLFMTYHEQKESLAAKAASASFARLGITGV